ncbi:DNA polymerase II subunit B3-1 [Mercurialis annua]|uniref:DNA polymerase II subunit B3-1 n=1 Tax=Mercurialis annua TaxID=3986 RepID=UPI0021603D7A|nr:DNA polymerase II subunit B3-1 [Mercurialis annua]XP_050217950.1 DNA polymerase II subunit B3-1 [Mercurialis annua]
MASSKKSNKEEHTNKNKNKTIKTKESPIKNLKSPNKDKHKIKSKSPSSKVKESPKVSIEKVKNQDSDTPRKSKIKNQTSSKSDKNPKRKAEPEEDGEDETLCSFPMSRIRRIIKAEDDSSKLPQHVVYLVNKATEMFVEQFVEKAYECAARDKKKTLAYKYLSSVVGKQRRFDFLSDFVPEQLKAEEALGQIKSAETAKK